MLPFPITQTSEDMFSEVPSLTLGGNLKEGSGQLHNPMTTLPKKLPLLVLLLPFVHSLKVDNEPVVERTGIVLS